MIVMIMYLTNLVSAITIAQDLNILQNKPNIGHNCSFLYMTFVATLVQNAKNRCNVSIFHYFFKVHIGFLRLPDRDSKVLAFVIEVYW